MSVLARNVRSCCAAATTPLISLNRSIDVASNQAFSLLSAELVTLSEKIVRPKWPSILPHAARVAAVAKQTADGRAFVLSCRPKQSGI